MPVTLAEAKLFMPELVDQEVIDEFRKSSFLLDNMPFDDTVTPSGPVLVFGYRRLVTQPTAAFRAINAEYTPSEVTTAKITGELKVFGGSFQVDRVLTQTAARSEVELNLSQKIKAGRSLFHDTAINGDTAVTAAAFDGLSKALTGTTTEMSPTQVSADWTSLSGDEPPQAAIDKIESFIALMDGPPTAILGNAQSIPKFASIARRAGYYDQSLNGFGQRIQRYGNVLLVDMGAKPGATTQVIPTETRTVIPLAGGAPASITGLTDLYAVDLALDGFHGITLTNVADFVRTYLDEFDPSYQQSGAVRKGEVEMIAAVALKRTRGAAVLRNLKVQ